MSRPPALHLASFAAVAAVVAFAVAEGAARAQKPSTDAAAQSGAAPGDGATSASRVRAGGAHCTRESPAGGTTITPLSEGANAFVGRLSLAPNAKVPEHRHASEEHVYVLHGGGTFTIEGTSTKIGPGASIVIPSNAPHSFQNGPEALVAVQVYADPSAARKYDGWRGCGP